MAADRVAAPFVSPQLTRPSAIRLDLAFLPVSALVDRSLMQRQFGCETEGISFSLTFSAPRPPRSEATAQPRYGPATLRPVHASMPGTAVAPLMNRCTSGSTRMSLGRSGRERYSPSSSVSRLSAT